MVHVCMYVFVSAWLILSCINCSNSISFGIILAEMLTHDSPFQEYLDFVEVDNILDALAGFSELEPMLPPVCVSVCTVHTVPK